MSKIYRQEQKQNSSQRVKHKESEKIHRSQISLGEFLLDSPFAHTDLDLNRDKDPGREHELSIK